MDSKAEIEQRLKWLVDDKKLAIEISHNMNPDATQVSNLFLRFAAHLEFILQRMK